MFFVSCLVVKTKLNVGKIYYFYQKYLLTLYNNIMLTLDKKQTLFFCFCVLSRGGKKKECFPGEDSSPADIHIYMDFDQIFHLKGIHK